MRFTNILQMPQRIHRLRDASWQKWRLRKITNDGLEAKLQEAGIQVIDANEFVQDERPLRKTYHMLPDTLPLYPQPLKHDQTHPLWKDIPAKVVSAQNFPMEGIKQAQAFTKSVILPSGLPESILETTQSTKIDENLIKNTVQHAFLWDAQMELLKSSTLRSLEIPCFSYRGTYGIQPRTSIELVIRNFLRLIESDFGMSELLIDGESNLVLHMNREGSHVQFRLNPVFSILSKSHLTAFNTTQKTENMEVPDITPFNCLLNFEEENIYEEHDKIAYKPDSPFPYIHTAVFAHDIPGSFTHVHPRWNADRFSGSTIFYGFAIATLMARRKFGNDVSGVLPEPITVQIIHLTGREWEFSVFQLNTLDLESQDAVKNFVWLTQRIPLFDQCRWDYKIGKPVFTGYNPLVFNLLRGIYSASSTN